MRIGNNSCGLMIAQESFVDRDIIAYIGHCYFISKNMIHNLISNISSVSRVTSSRMFQNLLESKRSSSHFSSTRKREQI